MLLGLSALVLLDELRRMHIFSWFPGIIAVWIACPFDEVLELTPTPIVSVIDNGLDLVLFLAFDQIRWRPREVGAVRSCFSVRQ